MDQKAHWEHVYATKSPLEVSWYAPHLEYSLAWIRAAAPNHDASILDVGGGASTLVDDLYTSGYRALNVLEISSKAIALAKERLGATAGEIEWIEGDVIDMALPEAKFDVWHDRAVFHFLTDPVDRMRYREQLKRALRPGGYVVLAAFSTRGPVRCSGLKVQQYDVSLVKQELGSAFRLEKSATVEHRTPSGGRQEFLYCLLERIGP